MMSNDDVPRSDTGLLSPAWAGTGADGQVDDDAWVHAMLEVELALARAQAQVGTIPACALPPIETACKSATLDMAGLVAGVRATGNPVVAIVEQLTAAVAARDERAAEFVHRGSTSQDILDTAAMLVCTRVLTRIRDQLDRSADGLAALAERHIDTPMVGRTLTQHAVPITFGVKAATWLHLVLDARDRIDRLLGEGLPVSLGGAAGTLSAYAEYATLAGASTDGALDLVEPFAAQLGLRAPSVPWHSIRTPMLDIAAALLAAVGAVGKFAVDVQVMTRTEIGELREPAAPGRGVSSAMPQKHNPVLATLVATAARQLPAHALILLQSVAVEDERSAGGWHAEWQPLRECLRSALGAATNAAELACGLQVDVGRMRENLLLTGGAVVSERLSAALAPLVGKRAAKELLASAVDAVGGGGDELVGALGRAIAAKGHDLNSETLAELLDPTRYTGVASALAERVLARHRRVSAASADGP